MTRVLEEKTSSRKKALLKWPENWRIGGEKLYERFRIKNSRFKMTGALEDKNCACRIGAFMMKKKPFLAPPQNVHA